METLLGAAREAESRAEALSEENRALETDLGAAAVLWEETERENARLNARVERLAEALGGGARDVGGRALGASARARRVARRVARARKRKRNRTRTRTRRGTRRWGRGGTLRREDRRRGVVAGAGSVRSEVEELEECAAAMRRQMRRRARGERVFARADAKTTGRDGATRRSEYTVRDEVANASRRASRAGATEHSSSSSLLVASSRSSSAGETFRLVRVIRR